MRQISISIIAVIAASGSVVSADTAAHTLNFQNVTSTRVNMTVDETVDNEKVLDIGDIDHDGDLDVAIGVARGAFGERKNKLYINDNGVLNEVSGTSLIPGFASPDVSRCAYLRDFDGDGWLDIYVVNDDNNGFGEGTDKIYIARHPLGVLTECVDESSSRLPNNGFLGASCGAVCEDFNMDGSPDVYAGNYPGDSQDVLLKNNGSGVFANVTNTNMPVDADYSIDGSFADMNGDGLIDLLVSSEGDPNYIYYNNLNNAGSGPGDFSYPNSTQNLGGSDHVVMAMEAADFNGDGRMDIYWSNQTGTLDRIYQNTGNNVNGQAMFDVLPVNVLPSLLTSRESRQAHMADLNNDGKTDVFVTSGPDGSNRRPVLLRNTSVNGEISFVDWTPAPAFPVGTQLQGWEAISFDSNSDGDIDILIGANSGDHLFEQVAGSEYAEGDLSGGVIPGVFNSDPAAVLGSSTTGEVDTYSVDISGSAGFLSVVLNGAGDYRLEILDGLGNVLETSDRGGIGVEEAIMHNAGNVTRQIRVTTLSVGTVPGDINSDGIVDQADLGILLSAFGNDAGGDLDGDEDTDQADLGILLSNYLHDSSQYVLEVLARN